MGSTPGRVSIMAVCVRTSKLSWYITNTKVNSAFFSSGVGRLSTALPAWGQGGRVHLYWVPGNTLIPYSR